MTDLNDPITDIADALSREYPEAVKDPCNECPWRRAAVPGHLGPDDARGWVRAAHSEGAIACHKTLDGNGWSEGVRQCRGMAIFRANVCKSPKNQSIECGPTDTETVFASNEEFVNHHEPNDPWLGNPEEWQRQMQREEREFFEEVDAEADALEAQAKSRRAAQDQQDERDRRELP